MVQDSRTRKYWNGVDPCKQRTPPHSRDRSRRESNHGIHARWLGQASWVTKKVVCMHVVAVFQIVHELWVVSHESFTCFTTSAFTLYTYYFELFTGGHTFFLRCTPQYISNLNSSRQKTIQNIWTIGIQLQYNICIYNTIQYNIWTISNTATGCLYLSWI